MARLARKQFRTTSNPVRGFNRGVIKVKKLLWPVIGLLLVAWSALAWFVHTLVGWGGQLISQNADVVTPHAESVEWLSWLATFGSGLVEWLIVGIWALGVGLAVVIGFAGPRLLSRFRGLTQSLGSPS